MPHETLDVLMLRHPSAAVEPGICYGRLDVGLADNAPAQIDALCAVLPPLDAVWRSPARRCAKLAEALAQRDRLPMPRIDPRLAELDFGEWEGCRWNTIPRAAFDAWASDHRRIPPPDGESTLDLLSRCVAAFDAIALQAHAAGWRRVAVVTHAGPMRAMLAHVRDQASGVSMAWPDDAIGMAGVRRLVHAPGSAGRAGRWLERDVAANSS